MRLQALALALALAISTLGCGDKAGSTTGSASADAKSGDTKRDSAKPPSELLKITTDYADQACACKDSPCITTVLADYNKKKAGAPKGTDLDEAGALLSEATRASNCILAQSKAK
jgi:hypothetical protein